MPELQSWLDMAPSLREARLHFDGLWHVTVWDKNGAGGDSAGESLTFAVVAAIMDFRKNQEG